VGLAPAWQQGSRALTCGGGLFPIQQGYLIVFPCPGPAPLALPDSVGPGTGPNRPSRRRIGTRKRITGCCSLRLLEYSQVGTKQLQYWPSLGPEFRGFDA